MDTAFSLELQNNRAHPAFPNQFLWRADQRPQFMLNADMALAVNLKGKVDPVTGRVSCALNVCPSSPTLHLALEYAANNAKWVHDFRDAFLKMTSHGCGGGTCTAL